MTGRVMGAVGALLAVVGVSGCGGPAGGGSGYAVLLSRTTYGVPWQLDAWSNGGRLCLTVDGPKGPSDHAFAWGGGGCGFDDKGQGTTFWTGAIIPGSKDPTKEFLDFGPLPQNAARIRVATGTTVDTVVMPAGHGLPTGRYWFVLALPGWPGKAGGTQLDTPQPLDGAGRPIPFQAF